MSAQTTNGAGEMKRWKKRVKLKQMNELKLHESEKTFRGREKSISQKVTEEEFLTSDMNRFFRRK
jgi:hypothetical protein